MRFGAALPLIGFACCLALPAAAQSEYKLVKTFDAETRTVARASSPWHDAR